MHVDPLLIQLIGTKILDWKLQTLPDYHKCAHVSVKRSKT